MKKKSTRIGCSVIAGAMLLSMLPSAYAASDLDGHWAKEAVETWEKYGVIEGYEDGTIRPDNKITRAEMAVILDRVMEYQTQAGNVFTDLDNSWYTSAILGANAAGVITGYTDNTVRPNATITRQEAAVIVARVLGLDTGNAPTANYTDSAQIGIWAVDYINAMTEAGYMQGNNGAFRPRDGITRAEVMTILNNVFKGVYMQSGEYNTDITGSAVINTDNVTLTDMSISGDLIIAEGVGEGHVVLDSVSIGGKLIVRGGGENSIIIKGSSKIDTVSVSRQDGKVRVAVEGEAKVAMVQVADGSDAVKIEGTVDTVSVEGAGAAVEIAGTVGTVEVAQTAESAALTVAEGAKVTTLTTAAANTELTVSGTVTSVAVSGSDTTVATTATAKIDKVTTSAANTTVSGDGKVTSVEAAAGSTGATVSTSGTSIENNGSGNISTGNGNTVKPGESGSTSGSTSGTSSGGGGSSSGGSSGGGTTETTTAAQLISTAQNAGAYQYADYQYVGTFESTVADTAVTIKGTYTQEQFNLEGAMNDMARYLGALYRVDNSAVKSITFNETLYTWASNPTLSGSNWVADASAEVTDGNTLVSAIVDYYQANPTAPLTMTLKGTGDAAVTMTFAFEITQSVTEITAEQLISTAQNAGAYQYADYRYVGTFESTTTDTAVTIKGAYTQDQFNLEGAMNDMARYLGALYRVDNSAVKSITFNETPYTWANNPTLSGSNWVADAAGEVVDGNTLVSAIVDYYQANPTAPLTMTLKGTGDAAVTLTFAFEITQSVTETTAEQLISTAQSAGAYPYPDYQYVGTFESTTTDTAVTIKGAYTQDQFNLEGAMNDMARYLGALYRVDNSAVKSITFNQTPYTWASNPTLSGSNWVADAAGEVTDGNTLVSAIVDYYQNNPTAPLTMTLKGTGDAAVTMTFAFEIIQSATMVTP